MLMVHRILQDDSYNRQGPGPKQQQQQHSSRQQRPLSAAAACTRTILLSFIVLLKHADETIITWTDPDIGTDVALSFQEAQGCSAIW